MRWCRDACCSLSVITRRMLTLTFARNRFWQLFCCCSVAQSCLTLWDPMDYRMPGFPVLHSLPEFAQTHVHWVIYAIHTSHPLLPPSLALSQHLDLFQSRFLASGSQSITLVYMKLKYLFKHIFWCFNNLILLFQIINAGIILRVSH